jgi:hypothetical protein
MKLPIESSHKSDEQVPRRWLTVARVGWIVCAFGLMVLFVIGIPAYYQSLLVPCTLSDAGLCSMGQLTLKNFEALQHMHFTVQMYALTVTVVAVVTSLLFWFFGIFIFWRKGQDWMGMFVSFLLIVYGAVGVNVTFIALGDSPMALQAFGLLIVILQWSAFGAFLLTFPTGRFVPRWSWAIILLWLVQVGLFFLGIAYAPPLLFAGEQLLVWGSTIGIQVYRYIRVYDAVQRQQTKWFVFSFVIAISMGAIFTALPGIFPSLAAPNSWYPFFTVGILSKLIFIPIPLGIGTAILRYRLWDIDRVITRTLIYALLTAILALIYFSLIFALQALVRVMTGTVAQQPLVIIASTLVIAALFHPLRRRIQSIIDRRFYRHKYDATKIVAAFSTTLRNEVDLDQLREQLLGVVEETMQPMHVSLWLRPPEPSRERKTWLLARIDEEVKVEP